MINGGISDLVSTNTSQAATTKTTEDDIILNAPSPQVRELLKKMCGRPFALGHGPVKAVVWQTALKYLLTVCRRGQSPPILNKGCVNPASNVPDLDDGEESLSKERSLPAMIPATNLPVENADSAEESGNDAPNTGKLQGGGKCLPKMPLPREMYRRYPRALN